MSEEGVSREGYVVTLDRTHIDTTLPEDDLSQGLRWRSGRNTTASNRMGVLEQVKARDTGVLLLAGHQ